MSLLLCIERRKLRNARDMTPPGLGSSIAPISLHNAIGLGSAGYSPSREAGRGAHGRALRGPSDRTARIAVGASSSPSAEKIATSEVPLLGCRDHCKQHGLLGKRGRP